MISRYVEEALELARYEVLDGGSYCATVRGLRGVNTRSRRGSVPT